MKSAINSISNDSVLEDMEEKKMVEETKIEPVAVEVPELASLKSEILNLKKELEVASNSLTEAVKTKSEIETSLSALKSEFEAYKKEMNEPMLKSKIENKPVSDIKEKPEIELKSVLYAIR